MVNNLVLIGQNLYFFMASGANNFKNCQARKTRRCLLSWTPHPLPLGQQRLKNKVPPISILLLGGWQNRREHMRFSFFVCTYQDINIYIHMSTCVNVFLFC